MKPDFIVVTGTRRMSGAARQQVRNLWEEFGPDWRGVVIVGGALGVDTYVRLQFGREQCWVIEAPWEVFRGALGKRWKCAGNIRNAAIAGAAKALLDVGFRGKGYAIPDSKSKGTWDCVKRLRAIGLEVKVREIDG
jgi:hypothetical protein